jgi:LDH2 family malate/lactate/ureidoglycolate dehydrogenase
MYAELRSNNQGIIKLITGGLDLNPHSSIIRRVIDTRVAAKIDGGQRIGMVVLNEGVSAAIEKAKDNGYYCRYTTIPVYYNLI